MDNTLGEGRPQGSTPEDQLTKYQLHRNAHNVLNHYIATGNEVGGFVVAFSILEDKITAMFTVYTQEVLKEPISEELLRKGLCGKLKVLHKAKLIPKEVYKPAFSLAFKRNKLLHEALWRLSAFKMEYVTQSRDLARKIDGELAKLKRSLKKQAKAASEKN